MSELSETWRAHKAASQQKRASNREQSTALLEAAGIVFEVKNNGAHLIVEGPDSYVDFWPGTGRWIVRSNKKAGFGVRNLLAYVRQDGDADLTGWDYGADE